MGGSQALELGGSSEVHARGSSEVGEAAEVRKCAWACTESGPCSRFARLHQRARSQYLHEPPCRMTHKHVVNDPRQLAVDGLVGLGRLNPALAVDPANRIARLADVPKDRVALISGGGSGHEPARASSGSSQAMGLAPFDDDGGAGRPHFSRRLAQLTLARRHVQTQASSETVS